MKQIKFLVASLLLVSGVNSCGEATVDKSAETVTSESPSKSGSETEELEVTDDVVVNEIDVESDIVNPPPTVEIASRYNYDVDFDLIKKAILEKNEESLSDFCTGDEVKTADVVTIFSDTEFNKLLSDATYESLTTLENEQGEIELVFSGLSSFTDEEGNVYESGVYLYFKQGDLNLELVRMLAAG